MTNFEKHIEKAGTEYSLSADEKARMQRVITSYMRFKPLRSSNAAMRISSLSWLVYLHRPVAASLVLVLVFGSGLSYAAESSLPGDALYTVKTVVNEPVKVALATNAETKAEVQMEIAERRIEEATVLSAEGRLDDSTQDELAASFKSYASAVSESIEAVAAEDTGATLELAARFETRLTAHENILAEVEVEAEVDEPRSRRLSNAIRETNEILATARFARAHSAPSAPAGIEIAATSVADVSEDAASNTMAMTMIASEPAAEENARNAKLAASEPSAPAPSKRALSRMKSAAEKSLKNAEKALRNAKSLSADARASAEVDISFAKEQLEIAEQSLEADAGAEAYAAFEDSLRISEQAIVYMKAAPALEKARSRAARNRAPTESNGIDSASTSGAINVSLPAVSATVTATTSLRNDDGPEHDANDDHGDDDPSHDADDDNGGEKQREDEDSDSGFKLLQKLNISL